MVFGPIDTKYRYGDLSIDLTLTVFERDEDDLIIYYTLPFQGECIYCPHENSLYVAYCDPVLLPDYTCPEYELDIFLHTSPDGEEVLYITYVPLEGAEVEMLGVGEPSEEGDCGDCA